MLFRPAGSASKAGQNSQFSAPEAAAGTTEIAFQIGGSASVLPGFPVTHRNAVDRRGPDADLGSVHENDLLEVAAGRRPMCLSILPPRPPGGYIMPA
jgi:hypothetical protein